MQNHTVTLELPDSVYQVFVARSQLTQRPLEEEIVTSFVADAPLLSLLHAHNIKAYDELLDFLASGPSPEKILEFQLSPAAQKRASELLQKNREQELSEADSKELDFYVELGDFLGLLRAKAQLHLKS